MKKRIRKNKQNLKPSKSSPRVGRKRACLCKDNTYSSKCCDGSFEAQGIGEI